MKTYDFYLDTKVTTWYRTPFEIEANSEEEAKELAIKFVKEDNHSVIPWEHLDDSIEAMPIEENDNQSTEELFIYRGDLVWHNGTNKDQIDMLKHDGTNALNELADETE
jgi:hypothetical protein